MDGTTIDDRGKSSSTWSRVEQLSASLERTPVARSLADLSSKAIARKPRPIVMMNDRYMPLFCEPLDGGFERPSRASAID